jgi:hypothetical protein
MTQDERIKGLETLTRTLGERLARVEGSRESDSKNEQKSRPHQWILPGVLTVIFGALIGLYGMVYSQGTKISGILAILEPQTVLKSIAAGKSVDPQNAKKELTRVGKSIRQLRYANVNLPEQTINQTTETLTNISSAQQDLPEAWSLIGDFITYRSQMIRGWQETNLPLCDDQFHKAKISLIEKNPKTGQNVATHGPVELRNCKIVLDSPGAMENLSLNLSMSDVLFTHCAVFYNGGPIILVPVKAATEQPARLIGSLTFNDCLFVVSLPKVPDEYGREFARALLASPSGDIKFAHS